MTISPPVQAPKLDPLSPLPFLSQLPARSTHFIGRTTEIATVQKMLGENRLLTLTGAGGTGKTRLALEVAERLRPVFVHGIIFVDLAPITNIDLVGSTIAHSCNVKEVGDRSPLTSLKLVLRNKRILMILDNFEQVVDAGPLIAELRDSLPLLALLITSRFALRVEGEQLYEVPPLSLPNLAPKMTLNELSQTEAVRLFCERAKAKDPNFSLNEKNARTIAKICIQLDGLPLAIELVAARSNTYSPRDLWQKRSLWAGPKSDDELGIEGIIDKRHESIRKCIAWSYALLDLPLRHLLGKLSVFAGGATLEAIETVCGNEGELTESELFDGLAALVDNSLLRRSRNAEGDSRFVMLETIREYVREQVAKHTPETKLAECHAEYYMDFAERAEAVRTSSEQHLWLQQLHMEHGNLSGALQWASDNKKTENLVRLCLALYQFWLLRGQLSDGRRWLEAAAQSDGLSESVRANIFNALGLIVSDQRDYDQAMYYHRESLKLFERQGENLGIARIIHNMGRALNMQGKHTEAQTYFERSRPLLLEAGKDWRYATLLVNLGLTLVYLSRATEATTILSEALELFTTIGMQSGIAVALSNLGEAVCIQSDFTRAINLFKNSILIKLEIQDYSGIAHSMGELASICEKQAYLERAVQLFSHAESLLNNIGTVTPRVDEDRYIAVKERLRTALGNSLYVAAWEEGQSLAIDDALALVPNGPVSNAPSVPVTYPDGLTRQETKILFLISQGRSNKEIGLILSIAEGTVERHVANAYRKTGIRKRAEVLVYIQKNSLVESE